MGTTLSIPSQPLYEEQEGGSSPTAPAFPPSTCPGDAEPSSGAGAHRDPPLPQGPAARKGPGASSVGGERVKGSSEPGRFLPPLPPGRAVNCRKPQGPEPAQGVIFTSALSPSRRAEHPPGPTAHPKGDPGSPKACAEEPEQPQGPAPAPCILRTSRRLYQGQSHEIWHGTCRFP